MGRLRYLLVILKDLNTRDRILLVKILDQYKESVVNKIHRCNIGKESPAKAFTPSFRNNMSSNTPKRWKRRECKLC